MPSTRVDDRSRPEVQPSGDTAHGGVLAALAALTAIPVGWMTYSTLLVDHEMPLPPAVDAVRRSFDGPRSGRMAYYADEGGEGTPLVLLHSINAAASAHEVAPLFEWYRGRRPVFAPDLPGFGSSERSDREYTPELYATAIDEFLRTIAPDGACDVLALSLTGEFAGMVAARAPERIRSLVLVSPTGLSMPARPRSEQRSSDDRPLARFVERVLSAPLVGQPLFDALVSRPSIGFFLKQSFEGPVPPSMIDYAYRTAHQPGARHAPLAFVSGRLFTPDVRPRFYEAVVRPALVLHDDAPYGNFAALPALVEGHPNWSAARVGPTRGLPHFERLPQTVALLDEFWRTAG